MLASRLHWRLLIATIVLMMAAAFIAPGVIKAPDLVENRVLADKPARPDSLAELAAFRTQTDAYVADHFPPRPHLIGALNRLRMLVGVSGSPRVVVGRDGWLFFDDGDHLAATRDAAPDAEVRDELTVLAARTEALRAKGIPYVVLVAPMQEAIYPEQAPRWYRLNPDRRAMRVSRLAAEAQAGEVIYAYDVIAAAKGRGVRTYSRHDTHWEGPGAWEGYAALMRRLKALGVTPEDPRPLSDFVESRPGDPNKPRTLALMLGVASFVDVKYLELEDPKDEARKTTTWPVHRPHPAAKAPPARGPQAWIASAFNKAFGRDEPKRPAKRRRKAPAGDWTELHVIDTGQTGKPVLMMTMDSFSNALLPFLYSHFSRIVVSHGQDGYWREDLIARYHPDVVVLEVLESGLGYAFQGGGPVASPQATARIDAAMARRSPPVAAPAPTAPVAPARPMGPTPAVVKAELDGATPAKSCNLEIATLAGKVLGVTGWSSELAAANTSPEGYARLQGPAGDFAAAIRVDGLRPDVQAHFNAPDAAAFSGFRQDYEIEGLSRGDYGITVYRRAGSGWIACRGPQTLSAN